MRTLVRAIDKGTRITNALRLGQMLQKAREEVGLTQVDLAERLGKKQPFVSQYEAGQCYLDLTQFILICDALCVDPAEKLKEFRKGGDGFVKEKKGGKG